MNQSFEIIKELNLDRYLKIVIKFSNSNKAPYHNFYHIMCKIKHTYNIAKSQGYLPKAIRTLVLADLFHDFNHSMGEHDDAWNVKEAIKSFLQHSIETEETNKKVISLIQATQYPYVISEDDVDLDQKITRDSDLLQQYEDNYIQQVYFGLSEELKRPFEAMLFGYLPFIENMKLHTEYAKQINDELIESRKSDVSYLINLLA